jgi:uncharacterized protein with ParB-like and HNH nuclease domain
MSISGSEYPIKKIFSNDFAFTIPLYQRAYSWTTEQSEQLLQDLIRAMENFEISPDELPPYFLGSVVLIKDENPDAQIIDGQQRITTLVILLAALRSLLTSEDAEAITEFLCEKGNALTGTPSRYRLRLRERDALFFQKYIQDRGGIEELKDLVDTMLTESQRDIRDNTLGFLRELQNLSQKQLLELTQFIVNKCLLVVVSVSAPDLDSAYRIFSVLNSRGLDLSYADILKAEIISHIDADQREHYAMKWEEIEALLGKDNFEALFFDLRSIFSRQRSRKGLIEEFKKYVYSPDRKSSTPQEFIDNILTRYAHALNYIVKANYQFHSVPERLANEINGMFRWLNMLDNQHWIPPALYYFFENWSKPSQFLRFLKDLERLVVYFVICRVPPFKRIDCYCLLLEAIAANEDLYAVKSPLQLGPKECREFISALNGNLYLQHYICRYVMLRLDRAIADKVATYDHETISIEHVLPRNPAPDSEWVSHFPTKDIRDRYVHRLGNLVLLSRGKNIRAENFDFDRKKREYFSEKGGTSLLALTNQVILTPHWTSEVIEKRQDKLLSTLKQLWRLQA